MSGKAANLEWRAGRVPVSLRFDDPYFSVHDGLGEARHVFLQGNGLPQRFRPGFHIGELGFGTGLNLLAAWVAWEGVVPGAALRFTSFEAFPLEADQMRRALSAFPELESHAERFLQAFDGARAELPTLSFQLVAGDARETLPRWQGLADAWFLDGFAPARNPELWEPELMREVGCHTAAGGTAATYSAAGQVRKALAEAGFRVERRQGFGRKRHMTVAWLEPGQ